jgi:hypothetical protein
MSRIYYIFKKYIYYILILLPLFFNCGDKYVPCKARLFIVIINETTNTISAHFADSSKEWYGFKATLTIYPDSMLIGSGQFGIDTIDYEWSELNSCGFTRHCYLPYRVCIKANSNDTLILDRFVFPYDTTDAPIQICTDCWHEAYDTIIVQ